MNPFYNIWNYDYIQQQAQMQHHFSQVKQGQDTAKALSGRLRQNRSCLSAAGNGRVLCSYRCVFQQAQQRITLHKGNEL